MNYLHFFEQYDHDHMIEINITDDALDYSVVLDKNYIPIKIYTYTDQLIDDHDYGYTPDEEREYEMLYLHNRDNYSINTRNPTFSTLNATPSTLRRIWNVYLRDFANLDDIEM